MAAIFGVHFPAPLVGLLCSIQYLPPVSERLPADERGALRGVVCSWIEFSDVFTPRQVNDQQRLLAYPRFAACWQGSLQSVFVLVLLTCLDVFG